MRVLVTLNSLALGGCPLNALDLSLATRKHGIESTVVGFRETLPVAGPSIVDAAADRGAELLVLDVPFATSASAPRLAALANERNIDLVHGYGGWDLRPAFHGPCRWGRRPLVQTVYEMYVPSETRRHQPLIVGTRYLEEEQHGNRPGSVDLISPPVDLHADHPGFDPGDFLDEFGLDPSRCRVVVVSRLDPNMKEVGIGHAIKVIEVLGRSDVDLVIVGAGDAEERLHSAGAGVNERLGRRAVVLCGAMHDPRAAYAAADIVFGMGSSAARSLAFGKPLIVAGEHGWYRSFTPETAALLFRNSFWSEEAEPEPVATLAGHLEKLIDDPVRRTELGAFGRRFAEEHFGLEAMAERLADVYERSLADHRRRNWFLDLPAETRPGVEWLRRRLTIGAGWKG
jgi:glycosyltransferase involved in cell wall biosynthesis